MTKSNIKWGTHTPVKFKDWDHVVKNTTTGVETPLTIYLKYAGTYSFEITNEDLFNKTNFEKETDNYYWLNNVLMVEINKCIEKKEKEKVGINHIIGYVSDGKQLMKDINETITDDYGNMGFIFTEVTVSNFQMTDDSKEEIKRFEEEQLQKNMLIENQNSLNEQETIEFISNSEDKTIKKGSNNIVGVIGIALGIIIVVSIIILIIRRKK